MIYDIYVRAKDGKGRWRSVNVMDLTQDSFNMLISQKLCQAGVLVGVKNEETEYVYQTHKIIEDEE